MILYLSLSLSLSSVYLCECVCVRLCLLAFSFTLIFPISLVSLAHCGLETAAANKNFKTTQKARKIQLLFASSGTTKLSRHLWVALFQNIFYCIYATYKRLITENSFSFDLVRILIFSEKNNFDAINSFFPRSGKMIKNLDKRFYILINGKLFSLYLLLE